MKILLIGHEGYLGRGLHAYLASQGHAVIGWDRAEDLFTLDAHFLARSGVELLINLSVMADRKSAVFLMGEPTDEINVGGARHLARILKGSGIPWIQMSTREVLGPVYREEDVLETPHGLRPRFLVDETAPYAPFNFYGKSKIVAEFISESHPESAVIRLTTCYTDFDHPGGNWMVSLVRSATQGRPLTLTNGGLQFRDPLHIDDLGRLMEGIVAKRAFGQKFHAGGGEANLISLLEFVQRANPQAPIESAPGGDFGFAFDNTKARRCTGWEPRILVRDKLPILVDHIGRGITQPVTKV
ncbi:MAG: NAD(P)-dependent oxidoreductase [Acidobacteria bacterium]|nr:NAD(P)-dependent oxidoreductase [Acidobacteriota bacterium]